MMVSDYHLYPLLFEPGDLCLVPYAGVDTDYQFRAITTDAFKRFRIESVAFGDAIRDIVDHIRAQETQKLHQKHRRGYSVGIIVTVNTDPIRGLDVADKQADCRFHVLEEKGIKSIFLVARFEK